MRLIVLQKIGDIGLARALYSETASIYQENSEIAIRHSIRESLGNAASNYNSVCNYGTNFFQLSEEMTRKVTEVSKIDDFLK